MMEMFLFGLLNGFTAVPLLVLHIFGILSQFPVMDAARIADGWYQFGFLLAVGAFAGGSSSVASSR
jgi:hypothetical protein